MRRAFRINEAQEGRGGALDFSRGVQRALGPLSAWRRKALLGLCALGWLVGSFGLTSALGATADAPVESAKSTDAGGRAKNPLFPPPPLLPRPTPGPRETLPAVFSKETPTTLEDLRIIEKRVEELVARVSPAVVAVAVEEGTGSGVVISEDGLVLTAAHVSETPGVEVRFTFPDGKSATGISLGTNHRQDAGLVKITDPGRWPHVELAERDAARLGDWVVGLGHPGGYDPQRSVVVRLGRIISQDLGMMQTDCTIIGGDSGGPLFDMNGRVVAIHSRISDSTAENFHVPITAFYDSWDRLARGETWGAAHRRSMATVGAQGVDDAKGFRLEFVQEDGPAYRAGLREGDLLLEFDGQPVRDQAEFLRCLALVHPGDEVSVKVRRGEKEMSMMVTVERRRYRRGP